MLSACALILFGCQSKKESNPIVTKDTAIGSEKSISIHNIHSMAAAGCEKESWAPEIYTFYGDAETINTKLEKAEMDLMNRRLYLVVVESEDGATIKLYEKSKTQGNVMVQQWTGKEASSFISQASKNIMDNKGVNCVGEQTQALFAKMSPTDLGDIQSPVSTQAAFSHDIKNRSGKYIRTTVFLLC